MTVSHKEADPALSRTDVDEAIRALWKRVRIVHRYWVPELGGTAKDWNRPTVYIDLRFPNRLEVDGKTMHPFRYLLVHECVERVCMDELRLPYALAHTFATAAERSTVEADGFSWAAYTAALREPIQMAKTKPADAERPPDLDTRTGKCRH